MNNVDFNVIAVRALKTFIQAFLAALSLNIANVTNLGAGKTLLFAAVAAGFSAVINLFVAPQEAK